MASINKANVRAALKKLGKSTGNISEDTSNTAIPVITTPPISVQNSSQQPKNHEKKPTSKNSKYQDINHISLSVNRSASEWRDEDFNTLRIFNISQLTVDESVLFGRAVYNALEIEEIDASTVSMMLYLAVSCRSTMDVDKYLLNPPSDMTQMINYSKPTVSSVEETTEDEDTTVIDNLFGSASGNKNINNQRPNSRKGANKSASSKMQATVSAARGESSRHVLDTSDKKFMAAAYSYICAYLLRLQCRQPDQRMIEALAKAAQRYTGFYDEGKNVAEGLVVTPEALKSIREVLARKPEITSTWVAWVAYNENESVLSKQDSGLIEYLATQVFAYQGMHVVTQTLAIHQLSAVPLGMLLREMDCQMTRAAVGEIYKIVKDYHRNDKYPNRKTYYRYARVWNEGYFSKVQSKACAQLLYLAAKIVKELDSKNTSDPTQIFAVKDMAGATKERLDKVAANIIRFIWSQADEDEEAGDAWKNID
ncbi:MAG: N protein [Coriander cytorhabdovirus 1]|nr:MAG: N protein [Coriander cytorhabdovirus 1]